MRSSSEAIARKKYASRVVLAFDADNAGQGAAERFYEWEEKYQVQVSVFAVVS